MDYIKPLQKVRNNPGILAPLAILFITSAVLGVPLAIIDSAEIGYEPGPCAVLFEMEQLQTSGLIPPFGERYGMWYVPDIIVFGLEDYAVEEGPDYEPSLYWQILSLAELIWVTAGILMVMGLTRLMYFGRFEFSQFKKAFTFTNFSFSLAIGILFLYGLASLQTPLNLVASVLLGFPAFVFLGFLAADSDVRSSALLTVRRFREPETFIILGVSYIIILVLTTIWSVLEADIIPTFAVSSFVLVLSAIIQSSAAFQLLELASEDPGSRAVMAAQRSREELFAQGLQAAEGVVKKMRSEGLPRSDIISELRAMRLSMEEVDSIINE